jgi:hypothetical protein
MKLFFFIGVNFSQRLFLFCFMLGLLLSCFFVTTTLLFSKIPVQICYLDLTLFDLQFCYFFIGNGI